jgi:CubicO group peptidase (beta-lactamase class C family)
MRKWGKKKLLIVLLVTILVLAAGFGGYCIYGIYKMNQLQNMTFEEMLQYTTKDNQEAKISVGIIQNGQMTFKVYGTDGTILPSEEHTYEIGSITKTFTSSLLCKAINEGKISLDDTIDEYLNLPEKAYYPTIRRLVTHTSGYQGYYFEKPMIANFFNGRNDFFGISESMLLERLGKINLNNADYPFEYSNFGMAVLGAVLEQIYDQDFTVLMNDFVLEDLGLENTKMADDSGDLENYWEWADSDAYMPAGALFSNITDMMEYVQMQLSEEPEYLSMAHETLAEIHANTSSNEQMGIRMDAVGVAWMIDEENAIFWHNGGTGNFNSYIGFDLEKQIGIVILSNLAPDFRIPATVMGIELLTSLQN